MPSKATVGVIVSAVVAVVFIVTGVALVYVFQNMIHNKITQQVRLVEGTETYDDWVNPPIPIYFQVWVFDIVNPDEIINNGEKPAVEQKGPYTYREYREKVNITFTNDSTVTYREDRSYVFVEEMSAGPETDTFTTLSIPMVTITSIIRYEYDLLQEFINLIMESFGEKLFVTVSVEGIMWGYEDALLKEGKSIIEQYMNKSIDDKFGLFYKQNGSDDGLYEIYTGVEDSSRFGIIKTWNNDSSLPYWTTDAANMLNGTDGTLFPPFSDKSTPRYVFSSDICRSIYCIYSHTYTLKGIDLDRYFAPPDVFLNSTVNPSNEGFCTPDHKNCLPSGLLNVSVCREGAPVVLSQPHFLDSDRSVIDAVDGIKPDEKQHRTYLDIEPMTGVPMNVAKKLQINVFLEPVDHITSTAKIKPVFLPILWLNESAIIDDKTAKDFQNQVQQPIKITEAVQYGLVALGVFMLICVIVILIRRNVEKKAGLSIQDPDQESLLRS